MRVCPDCHAEIRNSARFCETCGYPLDSGLAEPAPVSLPVEQTLVGAASPGTCSACGYQNMSGEMFCQNCGVQLAPVTSAPPPQPKSVSHGGWTSVPSMTFLNCPSCGYPTNPGDVYCENCGAQMSSLAVGQSEAQPESVGAVTLIAPAKVAIQLVVLSNNAVILPDMKREEWLVGRADPLRGIFPEVDLSADGGEESGVSRRHARLVVQENRRFIVDLASTNFTFLNGEKLEPGRLYALKQGDEIRFGLLALTYSEEIAR